MNWLGQMVGLPEDFLHLRADSPGGGVIQVNRIEGIKGVRINGFVQTTASEATFVCLLAGRTEAIRRYQQEYPDLEDAEINSRLVAYCSDQVNIQSISQKIFIEPVFSNKDILAGSLEVAKSFRVYLPQFEDPLSEILDQNFQNYRNVRDILKKAFS